MIKDKNKEVYTSPITEALEMRFEGALMGASELGGNGFSEPNATEQDLSGQNWW